MSNKPATITLNGQALLHPEQSPSLLHSLESQGVDAPYQCREGFCGACRAKLCQGSVVYRHEPLAFIRDGEILLCCSTPEGDITISFDD
ncbi:class I ribonucleotide reductase maintenance protein YfaE [Pseudoalteromonas ruthenica]|uniref:Ferredoxin n=1 Tax=Pseudoalteromonas ruthenica TaxID=151081 RepID=A0A0F4Q078_9GAMM|nr:ferredoxin [Pseudoalteromonas ruthenica]MCF2861725.1 class I ribonucleotide reductase maintenance protein YfaE [Pseudoalteromonas sp. CNAT2-18]MCG7557237.1 class I ribonucleotide reductase maintenance protein YfaE [Pseudoalteromonas sp. CNAT2-18.1]MCG7568850.1 class I ribonucleotide reductase maintenance protein YfaE [Pseudoalteromonas sp. CNC9-20]KJY99931.1 ferredoxin [Pseudoalteromonas ruthenica]